jgi:hypothetical protein
MSRYTRRHYVDVAEIINEEFMSRKAWGNVSTSPVGCAVLDSVVDRFTRKFTADNEQFDAARFKAACFKTSLIESFDPYRFEGEED